MWLITSIGFYSVVAHKDLPGMVVVRARAREDLAALVERHLPGHEIHEDIGSDYRFRIYTSRAEWELAAKGLAEEIDYPNFKAEVQRRQGPHRAHLYLRVWSLLQELQDAYD